MINRLKELSKLQESIKELKEREKEIAGLIQTNIKQLDEISSLIKLTGYNTHGNQDKLTYKDYKKLEVYLQYAFDKADEVIPSNAQVFVPHGNNKNDTPIEELVLSEFYLLKLIELINPSFDYWSNIVQIKDICDDWTALNDNDCRFTVEQMRIKHIIFSQNSLVRFIHFVKENTK